MKKEYISPDAIAVQLSIELGILIGSLSGETPVPDALEGDTDLWGDWL